MATAWEDWLWPRRRRFGNLAACGRSWNLCSCGLIPFTPCTAQTYFAPPPRGPVGLHAALEPTFGGLRPDGQEALEPAQPKRLILVVLCPLDDPERHAAPSLLLPELAGVASGRRISSWWRPVRIARGSGERWFRRFGLPRQIVSPASFAIAVAPCPLVGAAFTVTAVPVSRAIATPRERHQLASQAGSSFLFSSAELG